MNSARGGHARNLLLTKPLALGAALLLAILGVGLAVGAPFLLGFHATLNGLRGTLRRKLATSARGALKRFGKTHRRPARWRAFFAGVRRQWLGLLTGPRWRLGVLLLLTTAQWLLRYGALWFILLEQGHALPPGFVVAAQALVLHAALWTGVPAGGGGGDLGLAAAFAAWVPPVVVGTALVLWRFATLFCPLALGAIGLIALALEGVRRRA
jgi:uncharacterized protein (TIRG00374 family)